MTTPPKLDRNQVAQSPETDEHRKHEEESLDKTIEDSFPASDPPSTLPNPDEDKEDAA